MQQIKVKTPAKINLTLEIIRKREDGFHQIESVMQAVDLYDFLTIKVSDIDCNDNIIEISGNNPLIPYDKSNLVYIGAEKFLKKAEIVSKKINIYLEKHIPVAAGLAGGSSNAAGIILGLNKIFKNPLNENEINEISAQIGSDINFCLYGGTQIASSRGEVLNKINTPDLNIVIVKPKNLFISAKEAYTKYSLLTNKPLYHSSETLKSAIEEDNEEKTASLIKNVLEEAILPDYPQVKELKKLLIKKGCINAIMSGSGPSVFGIYQNKPDLSELNNNFEVFFVNTIDKGVIIT